nr:copine-9-like [Penaeus vannamei]
MKETGQDRFYEIGRTEMVKDSLSPQWMRKFEVDYRFEERQVLKFAVFDWDNKSTSTDNQDSLGSVECSLGEIMASQGSQLSKTIQGGSGVLLVQGDEMSASKEVVTMNFSGSGLDKKDTFGKSDPFLIFYRCNDNSSYLPVHKTEYIKKTLDPVWKPIIVPARILCAGDQNRSIKIECYDWDSDGGHDLIGECYTNLARSLHYRPAGVDNQYSLAIKSVGEIIQDYDSDVSCPWLWWPYSPNWEVSHEFFLNGTADSPYCQGVAGILQAYYHSLQTVGLYGPTNFSPVINHVAQFARSHQDGNNYFVLLIITDGIITRYVLYLPDTRKALVSVSSLPMSVIIVGVGNEDFSAMEQLDGDEQRLSFGGRYAERDIVQFVACNAWNLVPCLCLEFSCEIGYCNLLGFNLN